jgi:hypothetical protein
MATPFPRLHQNHIDQKWLEKWASGWKPNSAGRFCYGAVIGDWWVVVVSSNSAACAAYLNRYPQGRYATLAQPAQQRLQREEAQKAEQQAAQLKEQQRQAALREEQDAWRRAEAATDSAAVQRFLERYPAGANASQAQAKLAQIKRAEAAEQNHLAEEQRKQREEAARGPEWALSDNGSDINWNEATTYCANKGSGWRLPTSAELKSLYNTAHSGVPCGDYTCKVESKFRLTGPFFWTNERESSSGAFTVFLSTGLRNACHVGTVTSLGRFACGVPEHGI